MRIILFTTFLTFLATFTLATSKFRESLYELHGQGQVSNDRLLFLTEVPSTLQCASFCVDHETCVAFSTSPNDPMSRTMTCRGHDAFSPPNSTVHVEGSKTYFVENTAFASRWLGRPCTTDNDCPATVSNVTCFAEACQCLCLPGYYYSHYRDDCVLDCPLQDLQGTFLRYPNRYIKFNNIRVVQNCTTNEMCHTLCRENPLCRTVDARLSENKCFLQAVTALDKPSKFLSNAGHAHFQKTCL